MKEAVRVVADRALGDIAGREDGVPGVVAMATDRRGNFYEGTAGERELGGGQEMTVDTVFAIFSCTKAITGVTVMQLVEEGALTLDDPAGAFVPEIDEIQVLEGFDADGEPRVRPPESNITVRQLMLHTAGFGYEAFSHKVRRYGQVRGVPSTDTGKMASLRSVLLFDPGERWEYGSSVDWVGKVVEEVRGKRLGDVMHERVFGPLGMQETAMTMSDSMRERRATIHQRTSEGSLIPMPEMELSSDPEQHMGGGGLYGTVDDYMKFIRMILNDGAGTHGRVLETETVQRMVCNGLGEGKVKPLKSAMPGLANDVEFFPGTTKSWGYTFMINDEEASTGRPAGTLGWAGLVNLYYWIDRRNGIGGFWATQVLPFADPVSLNAFAAFETSVYSQLSAGESSFSPAWVVSDAAPDAQVAAT